MLRTPPKVLHSPPKGTTMDMVNEETHRATKSGRIMPASYKLTSKPIPLTTATNTITPVTIIDANHSYFPSGPCTRSKTSGALANLSPCEPEPVAGKPLHQSNLPELPPRTLHNTVRSNNIDTVDSSQLLTTISSSPKINAAKTFETSWKPSTSVSFWSAELSNAFGEPPELIEPAVTQSGATKVPNGEKIPAAKQKLYDNDFHKCQKKIIQDKNQPIPKNNFGTESKYTHSAITNIPKKFSRETTQGQEKLVSEIRSIGNNFRNNKSKNSSRSSNYQRISLELDHLKEEQRLLDQKFLQDKDLMDRKFKLMISLVEENSDQSIDISDEDQLSKDDEIRSWIDDQHITKIGEIPTQQRSHRNDTFEIERVRTSGAPSHTYQQLNLNYKDHRGESNPNVNLGATPKRNVNRRAIDKAQTEFHPPRSTEFAPGSNPINITSQFRSSNPFHEDTVQADDTDFHLFGMNMNSSMPPEMEPQNRTISIPNEGSSRLAPPVHTRNIIPRDLPKFDGNPSDWPIFICNYRESTISGCITDAENALRLQHALKGRALEAVRSFLTLPGNVSEAIETLELMFGRPESIIDSVLNKVRSEPQIRMDKLDTIINFSICVRNLCATMRSSQMVQHLNNPMLLRELEDKLPSQLKLEWARKKDGDVGANLESFNIWLKELAKTTCSILTYQASRDPSSKPGQRSSHIATHHNPTSMTEGPNTTSVSTTCVLCRDPKHKLDLCPKFKSLSRNRKYDFIREKRLCGKCLGAHFYKLCKVFIKCGINGCTRFHHSTLHSEINPTAAAIDQNKPAPKKQEVVMSTVQQCNAHSSSKILFRVVPIVLHGTTGSIRTFAFLDDGSSLTLMDESIANELGVTGREEPLCLRWTGGTSREEDGSRILSMKVSNIDNDHQFELKSVRTVKSLDLPVQSLEIEDLQKYRHLKDVPIVPYSNARPTILIGLDNWKLSLPIEVREGGWNDPIATRTRLGWTIGGPALAKESATLQHSFHICQCNRENAEMSKLIEDSFKLDSFGSDNTKKHVESDEEKRARELLESTTIRTGNRFSTGLLWRYGDIRLPDSYDMALGRLKCLERKMHREPEFGEIVKHLFMEYERAGYIRELDDTEKRMRSSRTWYLPTFCVRNPNKPAKIRLVWDAAATVAGVSLNSVLLKGPDLLASLPGILMKFRENPVAICGDIKQMFHQVEIRNDDQDSQRFIWRNGDPTAIPREFVMKVMTFGATCSPASAQFVKNLNATQHEKDHPNAARAIIDHHYMDDWLQSCETSDEMIQLANEVKQVHSNAGFEIRNWISNSAKVLESLNDPSATNDKNFSNALDTEKILGMWWRTSSDSFAFKVNYERMDPRIVSGKRKPTKREVLRILMMVFDPLGLIAPFLIYGKILLQDVWRSKIGWDDALHDREFKNWQKWMEALGQIENVQIPRCYHSFTSISLKEIQIHVFVDSSENAYAAAIYLRIKDGAAINCSLLGAKTKVSPLKPLSIPRLELQAAVLGSRFLRTVVDHVDYSINKRYLWSDSKTVLSWIQSDQRRYRQFVALRVSEILESTTVEEWRWVPTKLNVVDQATKWKTTTFDLKQSQWIEGPQFLRLDESEWPVCPEKLAPDTVEEIRHNHIHTIKATNEFDTAITRYSDWTTLLRFQAVILRFRHNATARAKNASRIVGPLTTDELHRAESSLIRKAQWEGFEEEITSLRGGKPIEPSSNLKDLSPYIDFEGVLRHRGRIDAIKGVNVNVKRPIILHRSHHLTKLIVDSYHRRYLHANNETVINELRQKFVIAKLRVLVKKTKRCCQKCKNASAKPVAPQMADLPPARLSTFTRPFTYTGIDFFGPIETTVGRRVEKRWGVLFTCLTIRGIHLEVAHTLSADSCIMAIKNFISRRGTPVEFNTDNGTNFKAAKKELARISQALPDKFPNITWKFIPPGAPHMGGSWERLIRSVKTSLNELLPRHRPKDELLRCALTEVENLVNSRPLTYVTLEDPDDEILTPNHFLLGNSNGLKIPGDLDLEGRNLSKNWRVAQQMVREFWRIWLKQYLPTITRRTKWFNPVKPIQVGNVVTIQDDDSPNSWRKGIVVEVNASKSGQVRSASIRTAAGNILVRPATKIAVLDVQQKSSIV